MIRKVSADEARKKGAVVKKKTGRSSSPKTPPLDAQALAKALKDAIAPFFERDEEKMAFLLKVLETMQNTKQPIPKVEVAPQPLGDVTLIVNRHPQTDLIETIEVKREQPTLN